MVLKFSFIVPTLNRSKDLARFLDMLLKLNNKPYEVIVVDQSDDTITQQLCAAQSYTKLGLRYYHLDVKSSAFARNFALDHLGDESNVVVFLDDDTTLQTDFLDQIDHFFSTHSHAQWWVANIESPLRKISLIKKIWFFLLTWGHRFTEMFVTGGGFNVMPLIQPTALKHVEWTSGCGMFFRRKLFDEWFRFEKRFMRYSLMEDCFLSYVIQQKYPKSLYFVPDVKMIHHETPVARVANKVRINQNIVHRFYFVKKFKKNTVAYVRTMFIFCVFDLLNAKDWCVIKYYANWLKYVFSHKNDILKSDFDFNTFIFSGKVS